ncbi:hypothetical protein OG933_15045 [Streptomyces sp. NBC_00016]|uniref:PIN domain-containing protein n=1 Tax=Streptomyces sp. NBC_00016 TaxID=2975622 RepID=UPI00324B5B1A
MQQRYALVIASQCDALPPLTFVEALGDDLSKVLLDPERGCCQSTAGGLLVDPSREQVIEQVDAAFREADDAGALLILAFIGHGIAVDEDFYFLAKDSQGIGSSRKDVHLSQLLKENLRASSNLDGLGVLLDTCHSGKGASQVSQWREVGLGSHLRRYEILTSAADQPAFDGIFTRTITSIFRDGIPSVGAYLRAAELRAPLQSACVGQRPQRIAHDGGVWAPRDDKGIWFSYNVAASSVSDESAVQNTVEIQDRLRQLPGRDRDNLFDLWRSSPGEVGRIVTELTGISEMPVDVLTSWSQEPPVWLDTASMPAVLAAAILTSSYGLMNFSARMYEKMAEIEPSSATWFCRASAYYFFDENPQQAGTVLNRASALLFEQASSMRAMAAVLEEDWNSLDMELASWRPEEAEDRVIWLNLKVRHIFLSPEDVIITLKMLDDAVAVTGEILAVEWLPGVGIQHARYLLERARRSWSSHPLTDFYKAADLAIRARDERRSWNGDSGEAVALACQALLEAGDPDRVLLLGTYGSGGQALQPEADVLEVREAVALAKIALGQHEEAAKIAETLTNPYNRARILALASRRSGRESESLWREALAAATEEHEEVIALSGLARCGVDNLPELAKYADRHPDVVAEIRAIADVASGRRTGPGIRALQAKASSSESAAISLAMAYMSIDDTDGAVEAYERAAEDFRDIAYRYEAVRVLYRAGRFDEARQKVNSLLAVASALWSGRVQALRLAVDLSLRAEDPENSLRLLRALLEEDAKDATARWRLVRLLLEQQEVSAAWRVFNDHFESLEPSTSGEACAWMQMHVEKSSDAEGVIAGCLRLMRQFPDSEVVSAQACMAILRPQYESVELTEELAAEMRQAHEAFFLRWPDSPYFKKLDASNPAEVIRYMTDMVKVDEEEARRRRQLTTALTLGQLPTGFLAMYARKSYSQALVTRSTGMVTAWSHDPQENLVCLGHAREHFGKSAIFDLSAAVVSNELPSAIRGEVINYFQSLSTTNSALRDARDALQYVDPRSTSTWGWSEVSNSGRLFEIPKHVAEKRARDAVAVFDFVAESRIRARPAERILSRIPEELGAPWLAPADLAKSSGLPLWVDDSALGRLVRSAGVMTISTPAILQVLVERGVLSSDDYEESVRHLISQNVGDVPLSLPRLLEMAREEVFQDGAVASVLARPATWINFGNGLSVLEGLLKEVARHDSGLVPIWVARAISGAAYAGASDSLARHEMLARIIALSLHASGHQGEAVRDLFAACREALDGCAAECEKIDPMEKAVIILRDSMIKIYPPAMANQYVLGVISKLEESDRRKILRSLLR